MNEVIHPAPPGCIVCHVALQSKEDFTTLRCPACRKEQRELYRAQRTLAAKMVSFTTEIVQKPKIDAPHISELCEEMMHCFGGLQNFARLYHGQIMEAATRSPGGKLVLDALKAMTKLIETSTEHRKSAPDMENLSDEDIARELRTIVVGSLPALQDELPELIEDATTKFPDERSAG